MYGWVDQLCAIIVKNVVMLWNYNACDKFLNELYSEVGMIGQSDCLKCEDQ